MKLLSRLKAVLSRMRRGDKRLEELVERIMEMRDTEIGEIMLPRVDMEYAVEDEPLSKVLEEFKRHGHTKLPVFTSDGSEVVGILHMREVLRSLDRMDATAGSLTIPVRFVPDSRPALDTLREFQENKASIALVVDEYGSVVGLVTMEDILEELVGEIWEEFDKEMFTHRDLGDGTMLLSARLDLDEASELLGVTLESDSVNTLGGYIIERIGHVPKNGESCEVEGFLFTVVEALPQRIIKLRAKRV